MISPKTANFVRKCMDGIPARDRLGEYPFEEEELEEKARECSLTEDDTERDWRRLFNLRDTNGDDEEYVLDDEAIVSEWVEALDNRGWFQSVSSPERCNDEEPYNSKWRVDVKSEGRGKLSFYIYLDGESLNGDSPDLMEGAVLFWLIEPTGGDNIDHVYPWYKTIYDGFWETLREELLSCQELRHFDISDMESPAVQGNKEGVQDMIRFFIREHNASVEEDPEGLTNVQRSDDEIEIGQLHFAGEIDQSTHFVICECDQTPSESLHTHLIQNGTVKPVSNSDTAFSIAEDARGKIKEYNDLSENPENSKALAAVFGSLGTVVISPWIIEVAFNSSAGLIREVTAWVGLFAAAVLFIGTILIILPMYRLQRYDWESKRGGKLSKLNPL
ncbi:hypothetical protein [Halorussus aquaticus]